MSGQGNVVDIESGGAIAFCGASNNNCQAALSYGSQATLEATPCDGFSFDGWSGDADCQDGVVTFTSDLECTATFSDSSGQSDPGTIKVTGGSLAGQSLSSSNWEISVAPGQSISGTVNVQSYNEHGSTAVVPLGYTWTWGSRQSSITEVDDWIPVGTSNWSVPISLTAPSTPGTYYIIFGHSGEYNMSQVLSCTSWARGDGSAVWGDGNDYWDIPGSSLSFAHTNGYVSSWPYLRSDGYSNRTIAAAPIKVVVTSGSGCSINSISLGQTRAGNWSSDCISTHRSGRYAQFYKFSLSTATKVQIDLMSSADTYLYLLNGSGTTGSVVEYNDEGGAGHNSRIVRTLSAGTYTIEATTYSSAITGSFSLSLTNLGGGGGGVCAQDLNNGVVCLRNGRFEFTAMWTDFANPPKTQPLIWTPVEDINATGGFQNNPSGIQIVMRVADGCSLTGTWWVWLGGFTDAGWDIRVRDTVTGKQRTFTKPRQGGVFPTTLRDSTTFTCN